MNTNKIITIAKSVLHDRKTTILAYGTGMFFMVLMYAAIYPTVLEQAATFKEIIKMYPESLIKAFGINDLNFNTIEKFLAVEYYGMIWPITMITLATGLAGSAIAGEIEKGTIEHILSKPITRSKIFLGKYLGGASVLLIFTAVSVFSIVPIAFLTNIDYNLHAQIAIFGISLLFALSIFSIGMMISAMSSEKGRVSMITGGIAIVSYVLVLVSRLIENAEKLQYGSLFYYYDYNAALMAGTIPEKSVIILVDIVIITTVIGLYWFQKRDITT